MMWFTKINHKEVNMKSLTLHAMDDQLADQIKRRADEMSISMNELAKRLLAEALGIKMPAKPPHRNDFAGFCGTWSDDEAREFTRRIANMETVDTSATFPGFSCGAETPGYVGGDIGRDNAVPVPKLCDPMTGQER